MSETAPGETGPSETGHLGETGHVEGLEWSDLEGCRIVPVPRLLPGTAAMTLGRSVLVRRDRLDDVVLLAHELAHVRQWREQGRVRFAARYVADYLRRRARGLPHREAYRAVPAEVEARRVASALAPRRPARGAAPSQADEGERRADA